MLAALLGRIGLSAPFGNRPGRVDRAVGQGGNPDPSGEPIRLEDDEPKAAITPVIGKRQAILDQAQAGALSTAPDFSKPTHARFRAKLVQIVALAEAGDTAGLRAFEINPVSSSPKAMARYRDLCVIAITARAQVTA